MDHVKEDLYELRMIDGRVFRFQKRYPAEEAYRSELPEKVDGLYRVRVEKMVEKVVPKGEAYEDHKPNTGG